MNRDRGCAVAERMTLSTSALRDGGRDAATPRAVPLLQLTYLAQQSIRRDGQVGRRFRGLSELGQEQFRSTLIQGRAVVNAVERTVGRPMSGR
ncbi:hypothetical protein B586_19770 [Mycobacterium haemophilum DSM 44634]|nr:hypothetical protein B586_19770 [Mycobacterium haemophilum DSM 44634]